MLEEETHHLSAGVRTTWLGIRSGRAPARPGMADPMKDPVLQHRVAALIRLNGAGVSYPARRFTAANSAPEVRRCFGLSDNLIAIDWVYSHVPITMENDRRDCLAAGASALPPMEPPFRMAAKAEGMSLADPHASPECTPIAAYRSE